MKKIILLSFLIIFNIQAQKQCNTSWDCGEDEECIQNCVGRNCRRECAPRIQNCLYCYNKGKDCEIKWYDPRLPDGTIPAMGICK